jgi:hypothetical protein
MSNPVCAFFLRMLRYLSQLLKSIWLFFPGIMFLLFFILCFWMFGQGKDIIIEFTENKAQATRGIFFIAIGFWVYVSWYSSRIIAYIKQSKQEDKVQQIASVGRIAADAAFKAHKNYFELGEGFLNEFPRMIGNACFLILELAVLQSPILYHPVSSILAWAIFIVALILLHYLNKWIITSLQAEKPSFKKTFLALSIALVIFILIVSLLPGKIHILILLCLLILFHAVFIFYINLRRVRMDAKANTEEAKLKIAYQQGKRRSIIERIMDYFCVPRKESGYFKCFLIISIAGIICYVPAIAYLSFARDLGPFPFIILAFGVLLAFGNLVSAFSIKYSVNFHLILFLSALVFDDNHYANRPSLQKYLTAWLNDRKWLADTTSKDTDIYFIMANGGASRSGYWTASVLGKIEDSTLKNNPTDRFSDHVFCLSSTSGGGVGVASFFSLLRNKEQAQKPIYDASAREFLKQDYFTYTFARMLGPDFFNYIVPVINLFDDRAAALESSFEKSSRMAPDSLYHIPFYDSLSNFPALQDGKVFLPILCINTTRMQDGNPGVVTNLKLDGSYIFNNRMMF